jgi:hypothetical protein
MCLLQFLQSFLYVRVSNYAYKDVQSLDKPAHVLRFDITLSSQSVDSRHFRSNISRRLQWAYSGGSIFAHIFNTLQSFRNVRLMDVVMGLLYCFEVILF